MSPRSARPMTARPPRPCAWAASIASGRARPRECGGPSHRSSGQSHGLTVSAPRSVRRCDERLSSASGPCQSSFAAPRPWPRRTAVPLAQFVQRTPSTDHVERIRPMPSRKRGRASQRLRLGRRRAPGVSVSPVERTASGPHRQRVARLDPSGDATNGCRANGRQRPRPCACTASIASSRVRLARSSGRPQGLTVNAWRASIRARARPRSHRAVSVSPGRADSLTASPSARLDPCGDAPRDPALEVLRFSRHSIGRFRTCHNVASPPYCPGTCLTFTPTSIYSN